MLALSHQFEGLALAKKLDVLLSTYYDHYFNLFKQGNSIETKAGLFYKEAQHTSIQIHNMYKQLNKMDI